MTKFIQKSDLSKVIKEIQQRIVKPPSEKPRSFIARLFTRFWKIPFFNKKPDQTLTGRIHELKKNSNKIIRQLKKISHELNQTLDPRLFTFVEAVIDPLLREIASIQKAMGVTNAAQQAKAFKSYNQWVDRAEVWIKLYQEAENQEEIIEAVVKHLIGESIEMIRRDVQVIADYQAHALQALTQDAKLLETVNATITTAIKPHIQGLKNLTALPGILSLDEVSPWRDDIDKRRQKYFEAALGAIDALVEEVFPNSMSEEAHDHLVDVISQITYLEEQLPPLLDELRQTKERSSLERGIIEARLASLEEEAHKVNLDLRLTADLVERLEAIIDTIEYATTYLD